MNKIKFIPLQIDTFRHFERNKARFIQMCANSNSLSCELNVLAWLYCEFNAIDRFRRINQATR